MSTLRFAGHLGVTLYRGRTSRPAGQWLRQIVVELVGHSAQALQLLGEYRHPRPDGRRGARSHPYHRQFAQCRRASTMGCTVMKGCTVLDPYSCQCSETHNGRFSARPDKAPRAAGSIE
jgi:hypothetical protein